MQLKRQPEIWRQRPLYDTRSSGFLLLEITVLRAFFQLRD
jgi:hypothetical protein